ncbi:hypothetical protein JTB14_027013 [Gonioctena quinquepunctata]|nr:hypothetical protein JTB14_027013 [Gonioctena quinquepunctata]
MPKRRDVALMGLCMLEIVERNKKETRRTKWAEQWVQDRNKNGQMALLKELRQNDRKDFKNYLRMSTSHFDELLGLISPYIVKQDTVMRNAIPAEERLSATLRYSAT